MRVGIGQRRAVGDVVGQASAPSGRQVDLLDRGPALDAIGDGGLVRQEAHRPRRAEAVAQEQADSLIVLRRSRVDSYTGA